MGFCVIRDPSQCDKTGKKNPIVSVDSYKGYPYVGLPESIGYWARNVACKSAIWPKNTENGPKMLKMADLQATLRAQYPIKSGKPTYGYGRLCKYFQPVFTIVLYMNNPQSQFFRHHHFILFWANGLAMVWVKPCLRYSINSRIIKKNYLRSFGPQMAPNELRHYFRAPLYLVWSGWSQTSLLQIKEEAERPQKNDRNFRDSGRDGGHQRIKREHRRHRTVGSVVQRRCRRLNIPLFFPGGSKNILFKQGNLFILVQPCELSEPLTISALVQTESSTCTKFNHWRWVTFSRVKLVILILNNMILLFPGGTRIHPENTAKATTMKDDHILAAVKFLVQWVSVLDC
jgi:hypothetical protein